MKKRLIAGLLAATVLGIATTIPAQAACRGAGHCSKASVSKAHSHKLTSHKVRIHSTKQATKKSRKRVHAAYGTTRKAKSFRKSQVTSAALAVPVATSSAQGNVIGLIKSMAPAHGVPTWFALRIAHVESNYKPHLRGAAGEYGVYQLKCSTAKGIGFSGNCAELLDARTNVQWGLKHLSLAIGKSNGNLKLAASKHNGGLFRRSLVPTYVAKVF
jgi:soluble lytic murein transglycosylase-like protein